MKSSSLRLSKMPTLPFNTAQIHSGQSALKILACFWEVRGSTHFVIFQLRICSWERSRVFSSATTTPGASVQLKFRVCCFLSLYPLFWQRHKGVWFDHVIGTRKGSDHLACRRRHRFVWARWSYMRTILCDLGWWNSFELFCYQAILPAPTVVISRWWSWKKRTHINHSIRSME